MLALFCSFLFKCFSSFFLLILGRLIQFNYYFFTCPFFKKKKNIEDIFIRLNLNNVLSLISQKCILTTNVLNKQEMNYFTRNAK